MCYRINPPLTISLNFRVGNHEDTFGVIFSACEMSSPQSKRLSPDRSPSKGCLDSQRNAPADKKVHDELADDARRVSLLDAMEQLSKCKKTLIARILMVHQLPIANDPSSTECSLKPADIEADFRAKISNFNQHGENSETTALLAEVTDLELSDLQISGLLYVVGSHFVHFLEGPTSSLLWLISHMHPAILGSSHVRCLRGVQSQPIGNVTDPNTECQSNLLDLTSNPANCKIHYFTECRNVRVTKNWNVYYGTAKTGQAVRMKEDVENEVVERIFQVYRRMLCLHTQAGESTEHTNDYYKRNADLFPHLEDLNKLHDSSLNPNSFTLDAFLHFYNTSAAMNDNLLHSETLWPTAPSLCYFDESHVASIEAGLTV